MHDATAAMADDDERCKEQEAQQACRQSWPDRQRAKPEPRLRQRGQRPRRHQGEDDEAQRNRRSAAGKIIACRQKHDMAAVGGVGEGFGRQKNADGNRQRRHAYETTDPCIPLHSSQPASRSR